jgi:hypothetical protein
LQDAEVFAESMEVIVETHRVAAELYFEDHSIAGACPPLHALLHIMARGQFEGKDLSHADIRGLFTREALLASEWYQARLRARQRVETAHLRRGIASLETFLARGSHGEVSQSLDLAARLAAVRETLAQVEAPGYVETLVGTLGTDPWLVGG